MNSCLRNRKFSTWVSMESHNGFFFISEYRTWTKNIVKHSVRCKGSSEIELQGFIKVDLSQ